MAESTRSKSNKIEEVIAKLTSTQIQLTATQNSMSTKLDDLLQKMAQLETNQHCNIQPSNVNEAGGFVIQWLGFYGLDLQDNPIVRASLHPKTRLPHYHLFLHG